MLGIRVITFFFSPSCLTILNASDNNNSKGFGLFLLSSQSPQFSVFNRSL